MQKVIAIVGPTASGKTALGVELARALHGEIISADSRQMYRDMDIIAGVPSVREMRGVPHHFLKAVSPGARLPYSAGRFAREAAREIKAIAKRNRVPIIAGGTGFYAEALLLGHTLPPVPFNKKLRAELEEKNIAELFDTLQKLDLRRAQEIDANNPARLVRAIEIATALGAVPPRAAPLQLPYQTLWLGLNIPQEALTQKVRARINTRIRRGMVAEARTLRASVGDKKFRALGGEFSLLAVHLDKKLSRAELIQKLELWELAYIRRQRTWFRHNKQIIWVTDAAHAIELAREFLS